MKLLPVFIITLLVAATGCREEWSDDYKSQYMESCMSEGHFSDSATNHKFCECSMEAVQKHYISMNEILANEDSVALQKDIMQCITQTISKHK